MRNDILSFMESLMAVLFCLQGKVCDLGEDNGEEFGEQGVNSRVNPMDERQHLNEPSSGVQTRELSREQREHLDENRRRNKEPIDDRKTDGPNIPST